MKNGRKDRKAAEEAVKELEEIKREFEAGMRDLGKRRKSAIENVMKAVVKKKAAKAKKGLDDLYGK